MPGMRDEEQNNPVQYLLRAFGRDGEVNPLLQSSRKRACVEGSMGWRWLPEKGPLTQANHWDLAEQKLAEGK